MQQAWQWKLQGEKDFVIIDKLKSMGLEKISKQFLSDMWRNPFYCGICVHKLLEGEVVYGKWEKMVSEEDFFMVKQILDTGHNGYKQETTNQNRPLNGFIVCVNCDEKMSGYEVKKKSVHYYKCQKCKGVSINANTTQRAKGHGAHEMFQYLLKNYTLDPAMKNLFKEQLKQTYNTLNKEKEAEVSELKKELEKKHHELKTIKKRYIMDMNIDKESYEEIKAELEEKIGQLTTTLQKAESKISNLENYLNISEEVALNISKYWASGSLETKNRIQELVFGTELSIDVKNRAYLTKK